MFNGILFLSLKLTMSSQCELFNIIPVWFYAAGLRLFFPVAYDVEMLKREKKRNRKHLLQARVNIS